MFVLNAGFSLRIKRLSLTCCANVKLDEIKKRMSSTEAVWPVSER